MACALAAALWLLVGSSLGGASRSQDWELGEVRDGLHRSPHHSLRVSESLHQGPWLLQDPLPTAPSGFLQSPSLSLVLPPSVPCILHWVPYTLPTSLSMISS